MDGVLTFHKCINYGSYWQARCMVDALRGRGVDAVILDHRSWRVDRAEWGHALRPVVGEGGARGDLVRYGVKVLRFRRAIGGLPRSAGFDLEAPDRLDPFDRVIVGSDEVWNFSHPWYGGASVFFGVGLRARRLVAYGASFGNHDAAVSPVRGWGEPLRAFHSLSVRDSNSRRLVESELGVAPRVVVDPCLLSSPPVEGRWRGPDRPFVVVYGHGFSEDFTHQVRRWAAARGHLLLSIGYRNGWADRQWLTAGPHDFSQAMARAEAVATNFFHGCIFALVNGKPFVCEGTSYRWLKIYDLMARVGEEARIMTAGAPAEAYAELLAEPPGAGTMRRIGRLRKASSAFLDRALEG